VQAGRVPAPLHRPRCLCSPGVHRHPLPAVHGVLQPRGRCLQLHFAPVRPCAWCTQQQQPQHSAVVLAAATDEPVPCLQFNPPAARLARNAPMIKRNACCIKVRKSVQGSVAHDYPVEHPHRLHSGAAGTLLSSSYGTGGTQHMSCLPPTAILTRPAPHDHVTT
jgi:hypothetical protein